MTDSVARLIALANETYDILLIWTKPLVNVYFTNEASLSWNLFSFMCKVCIEYFRFCVYCNEIFSPHVNIIQRF